MQPVTQSLKYDKKSTVRYYDPVKVKKDIV